jgi:hypothetical protein
VRTEIFPYQGPRLVHLADPNFRHIRKLTAREGPRLRGQARVTEVDFRGEIRGNTIISRMKGECVTRSRFR